MKKKKRKSGWLVIVLLLVFAGAGIYLFQFKNTGYSKNRIPCQEVENEIEAAAGVRLDLDGTYLTYSQVEEVLERIHLLDYITYEGKYGAKKIAREDWHKIYKEILDYLDSENNVKEKEVLVLGTNKKGTSVYTSEGTFSAQGVKTEELEKYKLYVADKKVLGILEKEEGEILLSNAYLEAFQDKEATVLFDGKEYTFSSEGEGKDMKNIVCDIVFEKQKIHEIRKKEETIVGNLITMDDKEIEIEGYGKIPLAERVPAYKVYGTLEEKSLDDIVIGNMSVQYVVGEGKVQAVLLKEPADIQNIRVLLLNESSPYYDDIYLTSDQKFTVKKGEKTKNYKAGKVVSASKLIGDTEDSCTITGNEEGKLYLTKKDGTRTSLGYEGNFELRKTEEGYTVVNEVSFEDYICGVLPSEMPEKFDSEALKAQAVCARSYAYMQLMKGDYAALGAHIDDSTNYQVYNKNEAGEKSQKAVEDTAGLVLKYQGNVVEAYYYSTSCGHTGSMENWNIQDEEKYGYLQSVWVKEEQEELDLSKEKNFKKYISSPDEDCYDGEIPYFRWEASFDFNGKDEEIRNMLTEAKKSNSKNISFYTGSAKKSKKSLKGFGAVTGAKVQKRGSSGAIQTLEIDFENGTALVKNEYNIRRVLGIALQEITYQDGSKSDNLTVLPSAYCTLSYDSEKKTASATGGGFGHGIGMSQYGADGMAQAGYTYEEILQFFYHDIDIEGIY